jgi:hypothetical protein
LDASTDLIQEFTPAQRPALPTPVRPARTEATRLLRPGRLQDLARGLRFERRIGAHLDVNFAFARGLRRRRNRSIDYAKPQPSCAGALRDGSCVRRSAGRRRERFGDKASHLEALQGRIGASRVDEHADQELAHRSLLKFEAQPENFSATATRHEFVIGP